METVMLCTGVLMIAVFFIVLFMTLARDSHLKEAAIVFGVAGVISAWVFAGVWLIALGIAG